MSAEVHVLKTQNNPELRPLADKLGAIALKGITALLKNMFEGADDTLFKMVEKAESSQDQATHFDTMRALRLERAQIIERFSSELLERFNGRADAAKAKAKRDIGIDELELVDSKKLEETIAISNMVSKANGLFATHIADLEIRLDYLIENGGATIAKGGLSPSSLCIAFRDALEPTDYGIDIRLLIYKLFDLKVISRLGDVYKVCNQFLVNNEVMPRIRLRNPHVGGPLPESQADARWAGVEPRTRSDNGLEGQYYQLSDLLHALNILQLKGEVAADGGVTASGELIELLTRRLQEDSNNSTVRTLHGDEARLIQLVSAMFSDIINDEQVTNVAKVLISRLQLPVMRSALIDASFFRDPSHPARSLINEIASLGTSIRDTDSKLYQRTESIVQYILDNFEEDIGVFEDAIDKMRELTEAEAEAFVQLERRQVEARRKALLKRAKQIVLLELRQHTIGQELAESVKPFLLRAWGPYMAVQYVKYGRNSQGWRDAVELLQRIVQSLQPGTDNVRARKDEQHELIKLVHKRLASVGFDFGRAEQLIEGLESAYEDSNAQAERDLEAADFLPPFETENVSGELLSWDVQREVESRLDADDVLDEETLLSLSDYAEQTAEQPSQDHGKGPGSVNEDTAQMFAGLFRPGVWFQIYVGEDQAMRWLKVEEYDSKRNVIVFANRRGDAKLEKDGMEFARDLQAGRSKPIHDEQAFERKLSNIVNEQANRQ